MAAIETVLYSTVTANATVAGLVGSRVYPVRAPQESAAPYVTYRRISDLPYLTHGMESDSGAGRWQFDCYAPTYAQAKATAQAVKGALNGQQVVAAGGERMVAMNLGELDLPFESELGYYRTTVDFRLIYCISGG